MSIIPIKDKEWFTAGVMEYQDRMYRLAFNMLQNEEDAKDVLQDALLRAYSSLESLKDPEKFRPWIMQILVNCARDTCRRRSRTASIQLEEYTDFLLCKENEDEPTLDNIWLQEGLRQLDEKSRMILLLYYFEEIEIRDISRIMGMTVSAVKVRLSRTRQKLKKLLSEEVHENEQA